MEDQCHDCAEVRELVDQLVRERHHMEEARKAMVLAAVRLSRRARGILEDSEQLLTAITELTPLGDERR